MEVGGVKDQVGGFEVEPLLPFGAIVSGVEFECDVAEPEVSELRALLAQRHVLVFRGHRALQDSHYVRFLRHFGELSVNDAVDPNYLRPGFPEIIVISNIVENGRQVGAARDTSGLEWHTDYCWRDRVSVAGALEAVEIPSEGGETCFVNMYAVYDALEPAVQERVKGLRALHEIATAEISEAAAEHPLVATNPSSGLRSLYVNPLFTRRLIGTNAQEGETLLRSLIDFAMSPEIRLRTQMAAGRSSSVGPDWPHSCTTALP